VSYISGEHLDKNRRFMKVTVLKTRAGEMVYTGPFMQD
jgi:hypothetical protein